MSFQPLPAGVTLAQRYSLNQPLGQGGMGIVYLANDLRLGGHLVAVKQLLTGDLAPAGMQSIYQEMQLLAMLDHPGLVKVNDFFQEGDSLFIVMDYVPGRTVANILEGRGPLPEAEALSIVYQLCQILGYLHQHNPPIIFRDLKPANIMVEASGLVKLIDFGIARFFKPGRNQDTQRLGTFGYASPEHYGRGQTDARSDIYSLGVLFHQLVTGFDPSQLAPMQPPPPLSQFSVQLSPAVVAAINQATQLDPAGRFQTVGQFQQALTNPAPRSLVRPAISILLVVAIIAALWLINQNRKVAAQPTPTPNTVALVFITPTAIPSPVVTETAIPTATPTLIPASATPLPEPTVTPTASVTVTEIKIEESVPAGTTLFAPDQPTQLTNAEGSEYAPALSPNLQTLAFMSKQTEAEKWQLMGLDLLTQSQYPLTNNLIDAHHPHFSPDGQRLLIASASNESGDWEIYSMSLDGSNWQRLTFRPGYDVYPSFSADGQWIVYMSLRDQLWGVYVMGVNGDNDRVVIDTPDDETYPTFAPDGQTIVFQSNQTGNHEIYTIPWIGGTPFRLTHDSSRDANPVYSPDGRWIVFESDREGNYELFGLRPDGTNLRNLTNHSATDQLPAFSADGRWLLFQSNRAGSIDIYVQPFN